MIRRLWRLPLGVHCAALAVVAALCVVVGGAGVAYFSDEGAVMVQAALLEREGSWHFESPFASIDPGQEARPFQNGDLGTEGLAPYAKHPLYPKVLAWGGPSTTFALAASLAGLVVSAGVSGLLSLRIGASGSVARGVVWLVGLASPLLFDAGLIVAHTLAAAASAVAALASIRWLEHRVQPRPVRTGSAGAAVVAACLVAGMLRTEALFLGPGLALGAALAFRSTAVSKRVLLASAAVSGSLLAWAIDRAWTRSIIGDPLGAPSSNRPPDTGSWVTDQLSGLYTTVVQPGYDTARSVDLAWWLLLALLAAVVLLWKAHRLSTPALVLAGAALVVLYALRLVVQGPEAIPGLVVAFPIVWIALLIGGRRTVAGEASRFLVLAASLCIVAVALTQYADGGGLEWGWRYVAFVLPLLIPPAAVAAWGVISERSPSRRPAIVAVVVASVVVSAGSMVATQRATHDRTGRLSDAVALAGAELQADGNRPIVLSWNRFLPQILYRDFFAYEWVVPDIDVLPEFAERLADSGVRQVILVGPGVADVATRTESSGWRVAGPTRSVGSYGVVTLERP